MLREPQCSRSVFAEIDCFLSNRSSEGAPGTLFGRWFIHYYINKSPALRVRNPPPDPPHYGAGLVSEFQLFRFVRAVGAIPPPLLPKWPSTCASPCFFKRASFWGGPPALSCPPPPPHTCGRCFVVSTVSMFPLLKSWGGPSPHTPIRPAP